MSSQWSNASSDLLFAIDRDRDEPLRSQLERQVREAIRTGRLRVGERLPPSRELAGALGLSRGLVQDAYAQLLAEGYLVARVGSGTRVAAGACPPAAPPVP
ncbi:winged helix-turn-helix domain-containing protein, partial [Streptomyces sp. SID6139]|nr:GntR family transcriptional regulator [Streptomyces sp. SID6139]